jgi:hypothetical protein
MIVQTVISINLLCFQSCFLSIFLVYCCAFPTRVFFPYVSKSPKKSEIIWIFIPNHQHAGCGRSAARPEQSGLAWPEPVGLCPTNDCLLDEPGTGFNVPWKMGRASPARVFIKSLIGPTGISTDSQSGAAVAFTPVVPTVSLDGCLLWLL